MAPDRITNRNCRALSPDTSSLRDGDQERTRIAGSGFSWTPRKRRRAAAARGTPAQERARRVKAGYNDDEECLLEDEAVADALSNLPAAGNTSPVRGSPSPRGSCKSPEHSPASPCLPGQRRERERLLVLAWPLTFRRAAQELLCRKRDLSFTRML